MNEYQLSLIIHRHPRTADNGLKENSRSGNLTSRPDAGQASRLIVGMLAKQRIRDNHKAFFTSQLVAGFISAAEGHSLV